MFQVAVVVTVCATLSSLHGLAHAVPREHSLAKRSNDLVPSHRSYHRLGGAPSVDYEDQEPVPYGRLSGKHQLGGRGLITDLFKVVAKSTGNVALSALKMGHKLVLPALKGVDWVTGKASSARRKLLKTIANTVKSSWKQAKAIEFPGKSIVALVFPNRIVSIVDELTNYVMYFATKTKDAVKATVAYSLYVTLKVIFSTVSRAVKALGFDCAPMNKTSLALNAGLINTVELSEGEICGLSTLRPENNVTITKDDDSFMVIKMPWVLGNLEAKIKSVDVVGFLGAMVEHQPVRTTVEKVVCKGTISFHKGTVLRFLALHLELEEISGISIKMEGAVEEGGAVSGIIDGIAGALSGVVQNLVNEQLLEMEKQISNYLLGNSRRRR